MLPPKRPLSRSDFRKWTGDEADQVIEFLEETNPDLLRRIEKLERTTRDLSGSEGMSFLACCQKFFPKSQIMIEQVCWLRCAVAFRRRWRHKIFLHPLSPEDFAEYSA